MFTKPEFGTWASKNVILVELDFPRRTAISDELKKQNRELANMFGVRGYPTVLLFDVERSFDGEEKQSDGIKILGKMGYMGDPNSFINMAKSHIEKRVN